jgi:peptidoglycan/xylan/chitin deacetylase (PgdA/CDA1 family)
VIEPGSALVSDPALVSATPAGFRRQMAHVNKHYRVVTLAQVLEAVRGRARLPRRALLITFDDAYPDFQTHAWPVLQALGLAATLFVPTAFPGGDAPPFWWDRVAAAFRDTENRFIDLASGPSELTDPASRRAACRRLQEIVKRMDHEAGMQVVDEVCRELGQPPGFVSPVLDWGQLELLAKQGVTICAHTHTHPLLTQIPIEEAKAEVLRSFAELRERLGETLPVLAYPAGGHDGSVVQMLHDVGVELALTCCEGHNRVGETDPCEFRRTVMTLRTTRQVFSLRLTALGSHIDRWRRRSAS